MNPVPCFGGVCWAAFPGRNSGARDLWQWAHVWTQQRRWVLLEESFRKSKSNIWKSRYKSSSFKAIKYLDSLLNSEYITLYHGPFFKQHKWMLNPSCYFALAYGNFLASTKPPLPISCLLEQYPCHLSLSPSLNGAKKEQMQHITEFSGV